MASVAPVQNCLTLMSVENKLHGGCIALSLIISVGALLGGVGVYGYSELTFSACMYVGSGIVFFITLILGYRRYTHFERLIENTLQKIENTPTEGNAIHPDDYRNFSYLFSIFIAQGMGNVKTEPEERFWRIQLEHNSYVRLNALIDHIRPHQTDATLQLTNLASNGVGWEYYHIYSPRKSHDFQLYDKSLTGHV